MKNYLEPHFKETINTLSPLNNLISEFGGKLLFVAGCIRNPLINFHHGKNLDIKDFDLMILGLNDDIMGEVIKKDHHFKKEQQGKSFGVYIYRIGGISYEIALARTDKQVGDSHSDIIVNTDNVSLLDDALRRESRMNSLYMDFEYNIFDPLQNGVTDIVEGIIRHNSDAFSEDPLRTIRACRQASQFEFKIHIDTIGEIIKSVPYIHTVDAMRVHEEFKKILLCKNNLGIKYMDECGILPELFGLNGDFNTDFDPNLSIEMKLFKLTKNFSTSDLNQFFSRIQAKKDWIKFISILKQFEDFLFHGDFSNLKRIENCFEAIKRSPYDISDFTSIEKNRNFYNAYFNIKANTNLPTNELITDLKERKFEFLKTCFTI